MSKIKLINENGVIKGIDPATGNEVPVEFDDLDTASLDTGSVDHGGSAVSVDDDLDLQGSQSVKNASDITTDQVDSERFDAVISSNPQICASQFATSGDGSRASPYGGGVQDAIDAVENLRPSDIEQGQVIVDGVFTDPNTELPEKISLTSRGYWDARIGGSDPSHTLKVTDLDVKVQNLTILNSGAGIPLWVTRQECRLDSLAVGGSETVLDNSADRAKITNCDFSGAEGLFIKGVDDGIIDACSFEGGANFEFVSGNGNSRNWDIGSVNIYGGGYCNIIDATRLGGGPINVDSASGTGVYIKNVIGGAFIVSSYKSTSHGVEFDGGSGPVHVMGVSTSSGGKDVKFTDATDCSFSGVARSVEFTSNASQCVANTHESVSVTDSGDRNVVNGRVTSPETRNLGGTDGTITPSALPADTVPIFVDAGGSATQLEGIDGDLRREGQTVRVIHTGGENVTLVHNDTTENGTLINKSGSNLTLSTNGDMASYTWSTPTSKWVGGEIATQ